MSSLPPDQDEDQRQQQRYKAWRSPEAAARMANNRAAPPSPISPLSRPYPRPPTPRAGGSGRSNSNANDPFSDFDGAYTNTRDEFMGSHSGRSPSIRSPRPQTSRRPAFELKYDDADTLGDGKGDDSECSEEESNDAPLSTASASDAYQLLGVTMESSHKEIKKAYNKLAKKFHPDKNTASNAKEIFQRVQEAWEMLRTKDRRDAYDTAQTIAAGFGRASPKIRARKVVTKKHFPICGVCSRNYCALYHRWFTREGYVQQMSLTMSQEYAESTARIDYEPQLKDALGRNLCAGCGKALCDEPHRWFTKEGYLCYLLNEPNSVRGRVSQNIQAQLDDAFPSLGQAQEGQGGFISTRSSSRAGPAQFDGSRESMGSPSRGDGYQRLGGQLGRSFSFRDFLRRGSRDSDRPGPKRTGSFSSLFKKSK